MSLLLVMKHGREMLVRSGTGPGTFLQLCSINTLDDMSTEIRNINIGKSQIDNIYLRSCNRCLINKVTDKL